MPEIERASVLPPAVQQSSVDCRSGAGQVIGPAFRLYRSDTGALVLAAAICWGLAPLLVMELLLAGETSRLLRNTLGMAGPGGRP